MTDKAKQQHEPARDMLKGVETAKHYKIGYKTLQSWLKQGLPHHILNGQRWYSIDEVDEWMKQH